MAEERIGPDFICIGAQKAGTGWLYEQLRSHPDFWMPPLKELHYFDRRGKDRSTAGEDRLQSARKNARDDRDLRFLELMQALREHDELDLALYAKLFQANGSLVSGDITPGYSTVSDSVVRQITEYFPNLKIIFIARDPVERAWSQLSMWVRHGIIDRFDENDVEAVLEQVQLPGVSARSYPSQIVRRWQDAAGPDAFGLYFFDDLKANPAGVRTAVIRFLGGDPTKSSGNLTADHNPKATKEKMNLSDKVRAALAEYFQAELKACASRFGGAAARWPARYGISD